MKKNLLILFLGFFLGFIFSLYLIPKDSTQKTSQLNLEKQSDLIAKDLAEYIEINDHEQKLKKADELLGKVMMLFLANISIHFNQNIKDYFDMPVSYRLEKDKYEIPKKDIETIEEIEAEPDTDNKSSYKENPIPLYEIANEELRRPFSRLNKLVLSTPYKYLKESTLLTDPTQMMKLNGDFMGKIHYLAGKNKGEVHDLLLSINLIEGEKGLSGNYFSEISFNGVPSSTNRGNGGNAHISVNGDKKREVLLKTSPNSFIQLILSERNELRGNYYDDDEYKGIVILERT